MRVRPSHVQGEKLHGMDRKRAGDFEAFSLVKLDVIIAIKFGCDNWLYFQIEIPI